MKPVHDGYFDLHTHICRSDLSDMLAQCRRKGIRTLGISEHDYQIQEIRGEFPYFLMEGSLYRLEDYLRLLENEHEVRLLRAVELDILPGLTGRIWSRLRHVEWDYVIGSVHSVDGLDIHFARAFTEEQKAARWRTYLEQQIQWIAEGYGQIIGHPVRMAVTIPQTPPDLPELLLRLAQCAKSRQIAVEVNARDYEIAPELLSMLIQACSQASCMVTLGSDAHTPEHIHRHFGALGRLLKNHGISQTVCWQSGQPYPCTLP